MIETKLLQGSGIKAARIDRMAGRGAVVHCTARCYSEGCREHNCTLAHSAYTRGEIGFDEQLPVKHPRKKSTDTWPGKA